MGTAPPWASQVREPLWTKPSTLLVCSPELTVLKWYEIQSQSCLSFGPALLAKPSPVPQGQQDKGSLSSLAATEVPLPERLLRASRVGIPAAFDGSERVRMFLLRVAGTRGQCSKLSIMRSPRALACGSPSEARARLSFGGGGGAVCGAPRVCAGLAGSARRSAPHQPPSFLGLHLPGDAQPGSDHPQVRVCLLCSVTGLVCLPVCRGAWLSHSSTLLCPCPPPLRSWVTAPT